MDSNVKTTSVFRKPEFWTTVVTGVSGLLLAFGVITPIQAGGIAEYAPQLIGALMAIISGSKFVNTQRDEKVEVFRAMCAMRLEQAARAEKAGQVSALSATPAEEQVAGLARAAGL